MWPFSAPYNYNPPHQALKHVTQSLDSPFLQGLFPHLSHSSNGYRTPAFRAANEVAEVNTLGGKQRNFWMGQTSFQASQNRLRWETWETVLSDCLHAPWFCIHTCTRIQKYTHASMHACIPGLSCCCLRRAKPALKDNKHSANNIWIRTRSTEAQWTEQMRIGLFASARLYVHT